MKLLKFNFMNIKFHASFMQASCKPYASLNVNVSSALRLRCVCVAAALRLRCFHVVFMQGIMFHAR